MLFARIKGLTKKQVEALNKNSKKGKSNGEKKKNSRSYCILKG